MTTFYNRVVFIPTAGGTASFTVRAAAPGARSPVGVVPNGALVSYTAVGFDLTQWECGQGVYSVGVLTRATLRASSTGSFVAFTNAPTIQLDFHAEDIATHEFSLNLPGSTTTNAIVRWGTATADTLANSNVTIDNTGNIAGTGDIAPASNATSALGSGALAWTNLFLSSGSTINFNNGNYTLTHSAGNLRASGTFSVGDTNFTLNLNTATPLVQFDSGDSLGYVRASNTFQWSVASSSTLTLSTTVLAPAANDGIALGTGPLSFSDLFLASGGVVNFNNGDYTFTHSAGILTANKDLQITTPGTAAKSVIVRDGTNFPALTGSTVSAGNTLATTSTVDLVFIIGDGTNTISTGIAPAGSGGYWSPPLDFGGTIVSWSIVADASGSISIDVLKCTFTQFDSGGTHPVAGDKISASAPITFTTTTKAQSATLTGWTTSFSANDIFAFNVSSVTTCKQVKISIKVTKTS